MNQFQESLRQLRPRFQELAPQPISAIVVEHMQSIGPADVRELLRGLLPDDRMFGGIYSDSRGLRRSYQWQLPNESTANQFERLARSAGNFVESVCRPLVPEETISRRNLEERCLFTVFDLAVDGHLPPHVVIKRKNLANNDIAVNRLLSWYPESEDEQETRSEHVAELERLGF